MAIQIRSTSLDFSDRAPNEARAEIKTLLDREPKSTRRVYAALAHKIWSLLIERRLDSEIRDWHVLLQAMRSYFSAHDEVAAERVVALSDLLRESIVLSETNSAADLAKRAHANRILNLLSERKDSVLKREIMEELNISGQNLSNVLTKLSGNDLIRRETRGKEAAFRLTRLGREIIGKEPEVDALHVSIMALLETSRAVPTNGYSAYKAMLDSPQNPFGRILRAHHVEPISNQLWVFADSRSDRTVPLVSNLGPMNVLTREKIVSAKVGGTGEKIVSANAGGS